jgi:hypothetical protein
MFLWMFVFGALTACLMLCLEKPVFVISTAVVGSFIFILSIGKSTPLQVNQQAINQSKESLVAFVFPRDAHRSTVKQTPEGRHSRHWLLSKLVVSLVCVVAVAELRHMSHACLLVASRHHLMVDALRSYS